MKKSTKGALAAGAAAVLLLGGAGSLAYWTDNASITGTSITTGSLALNNDACGSWTLDKGVTGKEAPYVAQVLVPGDSLTKVCTYTVSATGDHLQATLTTPTAVALTGTLASAPGVSAPVTATYQLATDTSGTGAAAAPAQITSANDGKVLIATIKVDFPYGTADSTPTATDGTNGNATQSKAASLADISLTLTQDNNHA